MNNKKFAAALQSNPDESEGYALQTRLIEASRTLELAINWILENKTTDRDYTYGHGHRAADELEDALASIQRAIDNL